MDKHYVSPDDAKNGLAPHWGDAGKIHDWRNYVPEPVQALWWTFTPEQRSALVDWADDWASREDWD